MFDKPTFQKNNIFLLPCNKRPLCFILLSERAGNPAADLTG
ncbi:hypothetical protein HMPREF0372_01676 [Flavonifractor plautii ATCC 29863]|uniref:Uncharacterized protein n=1 Tax=Flavonifractor plautii ATCC 29863 TaxID=411475 RepID=G9YQ83_FLAPL|nr:hypothetical protein HMPREF0372_01676 [Flavonifractor plautii ATCC 29863]